LLRSLCVWFLAACCACQQQEGHGGHGLPVARPPSAISETEGKTEITTQDNMSSPDSSEHPYSMPRVGGQLVVPGPEVLAALPPDGGDEYNRLIFESSPYLLQHARNPVDWFPWGEEAFARAKAENKPIFLSIGYSTCHWCHVMEHESFEDPEVARLLNESYVSIKVDREERPDVDHVYMQTCQAMTGSGGWPLTVVATPDRKPFFAGTYFPRTARFGRVGMLELVPRLAELWSKEEERVLDSVNQIVAALGQSAPAGRGSELEERTIEAAEDWFRSSYDATHGGFGDAPKFPVPHNLRLLLRRYARGSGDDLLPMCEQTLTAMRLGGLFDQVGFGFHRYSTDAQWLVPHFEKMLYDQALLVEAYVEAWAVTGDPFYRRTAEETLGYVLRKLRSDDGLFRSAEDADSQGPDGELEEGLCYVWTPEQLRAALGAEDAAFVAELYGVREGGNFVEEATGQATGGNILHLERRLEATARARHVEPEALAAQVEALRQKLFAVREQRIPPLEDDKRLCDWNGLAIGALSLAGGAFGEERYLEAARTAARRLLQHLRDPESGRLWKRSRAGEAGVMGVLDDYAYVSNGLMALYDATGELRWLREAQSLVELALALFWDDEQGGFFLTPSDGEELFTRPKESYDGALPSGNGVLAGVLLRLGRLTGEARYEERAAELLAALSGDVLRAPAGHTRSLLALDFATGPSLEVVVVGKRGSADYEAMLSAARRAYGGHFVLLAKDVADEAACEALAAFAPFTASLVAVEGRATAYVCRGFACDAPLHDAGELALRLERGARAGAAEDR
jgi:uncharacterized protein YyaL (SSP411 family)